MAGELQIVGFRVGQQDFGLPIASVHEIVRPPEITPVPQSAQCVAGVMNLRGRIVPVVDLRLRFQQSAENSPKNRVLVVSVEGRFVGMLVDTASEVLKVMPADIESGPRVFGGETEAWVTGIAKYQGRLVVLVDAGKLLPAQAVSAS